MTKADIAVLLKRARTDAGLTQKETAEILKKKQQTVASWEMGLSQPDTLTIIALSELFQVSLDDMLGTAQRTAAKKIRSHEDLLVYFKSLNPVGQMRLLDYALELTLIDIYKS